ncbi:MAG: DsbA family protein [Salinirussus sp.]
METADRLTVYADYICPFCFLGHVSLSRYRAQRDEPLTVEWHPFDLRADERGPDGELDQDRQSGKDEDYFAEVRENVSRIADRYEVEMARTVARDIDSRPAQLVSVYVQMEHPDKWQQFDANVYDALWREDRDISDPSVVRSIARDVGLDGDAIRGALDDPMIERRLEDQFEAARLKGISGVPTFVAGDHTARGAVPPTHLRRLVEGK